MLLLLPSAGILRPTGVLRGAGVRSSRLHFFHRHHLEPAGTGVEISLDRDHLFEMLTKQAIGVLERRIGHGGVEDIGPLVQEVHPDPSLVTPDRTLAVRFSFET